MSQDADSVARNAKTKSAFWRFVRRANLQNALKPNWRYLKP